MIYESLPFLLPYLFSLLLCYMIDMAGITVSSYIYTVCKTSTIGFQCDPRTRIIYYYILYTEKFFVVVVEVLLIYILVYILN